MAARRSLIIGAIGLVVFMVILTGCNVVGGAVSGEVIKEQREVDEFTKIDLKGTGTLTVAQGDTTELEIIAREGAIDNITTKVSGDTLRISYKRFSFFQPFSGPVEFRITTPDLNAVKISGNGNLEMTELDTDEFSFNVDGSGRADIEELLAETLSIDVNGSGRFNAAGEVDDVSIEINGSGNFQGSDIDAQNVIIRISGSGKAEVSAEERLDVYISGSGNVEYSGRPRIDQRITGSGSVQNTDE